MAARFLRTCRSKVRTSKYHSEGSTPSLPVGFEFRAAWHRPARVSRAPSKEGARKGEGKLRRSCAHPRAGASRRRARPAPVPDWPVVPSRASRWPPSSLSSPLLFSLFRLADTVVASSFTRRPLSTRFSTFFFLSLLTYPILIRSRRVVELVDRRAGRPRSVEEKSRGEPITRPEVTFPYEREVKTARE